jgi:hypothetical protein
MLTLNQSNPHLRDRKQTRRRIVENVRQSSAFEGVRIQNRQGGASPRSTASAKNSANGR